MICGCGFHRQPSSLVEPNVILVSSPSGTLGEDLAIRNGATLSGPFQWPDCFDTTARVVVANGVVVSTSVADDVELGSFLDDAWAGVLVRPTTVSGDVRVWNCDSPAD